MQKVLKHNNVSLDFKFFLFFFSRKIIIDHYESIDMHIIEKFFKKTICLWCPQKNGGRGATNMCMFFN